MGPRRVGKTVILNQVIDKLLSSGQDARRILYLSLDTSILQGLTLEELLDLYKSKQDYSNFDGCFIIFDEVQYYAEWDVHLKALVDENKKTKFIASGSAAAALNRGSKESGAGRFTDSLLGAIIEKVLLRDLPLLYGIQDIQELTRLFNTLRLPS